MGSIPGSVDSIHSSSNVTILHQMFVCLLQLDGATSYTASDGPGNKKHLMKLPWYSFVENHYPSPINCLWDQNIVLFKRLKDSNYKPHVSSSEFTTYILWIAYKSKSSTSSQWSIFGRVGRFGQPFNQLKVMAMRLKTVSAEISTCWCSHVNDPSNDAVDYSLLRVERRVPLLSPTASCLWESRYR